MLLLKKLCHGEHDTLLQGDLNRTERSPVICPIQLISVGPYGKSELVPALSHEDAFAQNRELGPVATPQHL